MLATVLLVVNDDTPENMDMYVPAHHSAVY